MQALLWFILLNVAGRDAKLLFSKFLQHGQSHQPQEGILEPDSETHIPQFRSDGKLTFISAETKMTLASIDVEVPKIFSKFMEGLMWRKEMSDEQSMLFRWNEDGPRSFWMENTYVPLDIVYASSGYQIVSIKSAFALSRDSVPSDSAAQFAIEVPQGWCNRHGVRVGDSVQFQLDNVEGSFVAQDMPDFGASKQEVAFARAVGNYH